MEKEEESMEEEGIKGREEGVKMIGIWEEQLQIGAEGTACGSLKR